MIYLDNAATTPINEVAVETIVEMLEQYGNPSSLYPVAHEAKQYIETARKIIADKIGAEPEEIIFTSGGSEANNLAIKGWSSVHKRDNYSSIYTSFIEHSSINNIRCFHYFQKIRVNKNGLIDIEHFESGIKKLTEGRVIGVFLVSVIMVNNEIGTIQDIKKISEIVHRYGGILHTDAVQAFGHINIDVNELGIDLMSASAHKIGGPKGVGFLYKRKGIELEPLIHGGRQEMGMRAGTENVPYIVAFENAVEQMIDCESYWHCVEIKRTILLGMLRRCEIADKITIVSPDIAIDGRRTCLPSIISMRIEGIKAQQLVSMLGEYGVCVSAGSACNSGNDKPSHVLKAIGLTDEQALSTIRVSMSEYTTREELEGFVCVLEECVQTLWMLENDVIKKE